LARSGSLALAQVVLFGCSAERGVEIGRVFPASGPYGTIIAVEGSGLDVNTKRILFENGVSITLLGDQASFVSWTDEQIVFRMPSPGAGSFRLDSPDYSYALGRFEPSPWSPLTLSAVDSRDRLDWVALGPDVVVEAVLAESKVELRFLGPDGVDAVQTLDAKADTVKLLAAGPDAVSGFFFAKRTVWGSFAATRGGVDVVAAVPPATADALVAADRDDEGSYAWLSDPENQRLSKWRVTAGALVESQAIDDPAESDSAEQVLAARDRHTWRVWAVNDLQLDTEVRVSAAYLAPDAEEFAEALELGSADDLFSRMSIHGVSLGGELAVDFCGSDEDAIIVHHGDCVSVTADPESVLEHSEGDAEERNLSYAFDEGIAPLECEDGVSLLTMPARDEPPAPLFSPCAPGPWEHRLDSNGVPSFRVSTVEGSYVLTKH